MNFFYFCENFSCFRGDNLLAACYDPLRTGVFKVVDRQIVEFEAKVKSTLEWSGLDATTKTALWQLMSEVSDLIEKIAH